ncbi:hypothetical protein FOG51_03525 [Hanseniaspora uvarum]|jgi:magnesium-dependent phosphatase 1|uniref:Putative magnesium-dependent phosphatase n=1 Tax=Hanseniaspora uvarum TaxID=29833 RepID=A0A1E5R719_HANUV|nr:hypothetical protein FOG48_03693 [Hanseniaspora uvarum]KKA01435.1 hypothetical protein D499_0AD00220 [Hanseniaspora uvarum DSM 2768]KAF0272144.1 hypothetical protein FOG51_03525 [Hanseniaspora uvarum]KAF0278780.1 hypothetical protein FOG50_00361 [Hanseniaspora uvarum]OEJ82681.1 putative magnesium-dependent phosphatase [Hanseniaspora uvarum]
MAKEYPDIAVFDLDYTIWPTYADTNISVPVKFDPENNHLVDSYGYVVKLFPDVLRIFEDLQNHGVTILTASRTWAPEVAKEMIDEFGIKKYITASEWGERSKKGHIQDLLKSLGYTKSEIPNLKIALFDDEGRNKDVRSIGVDFVYLNASNGVTWRDYQNYLEGKVK